MTEPLSSWDFSHTCCGDGAGSLTFRKGICAFQRIFLTWRENKQCLWSPTWVNGHFTPLHTCLLFLDPDMAGDERLLLWYISWDTVPCQTHWEAIRLLSISPGFFCLIQMEIMNSQYTSDSSPDVTGWYQVMLGVNNWHSQLVTAFANCHYLKLACAGHLRNRSEYKHWRSII